jgi:predicted transcriptional regulator
MATDTPSRSSLPELHELEFAIMEQVWQLGRASVHEVHDKLNASDAKQRAYTTVLSVMRRLHQKGFLARERTDRVDYYTPVVSRTRYAHDRTQMIVDSLVDQYGDVALAHFARKVESLSLGQLAKLRELAAEEQHSG